MRCSQGVSEMEWNGREGVKGAAGKLIYRQPYIKVDYAGG